METDDEVISIYLKIKRNRVRYANENFVMKILGNVELCDIYGYFF